MTAINQYDFRLEHRTQEAKREYRDNIPLEVKEIPDKLSIIDWVFIQRILIWKVNIYWELEIRWEKEYKYTIENWKLEKIW